MLALAAVMLVVLGIGAGLLIAGRDGDGGRPSPASSSAPSTANGSAPPDVSRSPATWANDVTFYDVPGGLRLPRSASAGPHTVTARGALASGFAHSPQGAIMAAINISDRTAGALGEPIYRPTIEQQVVGDAKAALLATAQREGRPDVPAPGDRVEGSDAREAGWQLLSYTDASAQVRLLGSKILSNGKTLYAAVPVEVRWIDDDWRLVAPASGDWAGTGEVVTDTGPFVLFSGH